MNKQMIRFGFSWILLGFYLILLIKFVVFKDMDMIQVGRLHLYFGGTQTGPGNFIPFKTIIGYFLGKKGLLIAGLNLLGNLLLLAPIGFLLPEGFPKIRRNAIFMLAMCTSLSIEIIQHIFQIGIFDVDDILLNSVGLGLGYYVHAWFSDNWRLAGMILLAVILMSALSFYLSHSVPMIPMPPR